MPLGLRFETLLLYDDPARQYTLLEQMLLPGAFRVEIIVNNPPNHVEVRIETIHFQYNEISTQEEGRKVIWDIVEAFEASPYTFGRAGTEFFLLEYDNFLVCHLYDILMVRAIAEADWLTLDVVIQRQHIIFGETYVMAA